MKINQDNYEQYFLDHVDGNLSPEMEEELSDFLEANPDLKAVLEEFDPSPVEPIDIQNDKLKTKLKKQLLFTDHINEDNIDEWMIRDIEGLLDKSEESELAEFLAQNQAYSHDYKIFGYTKLSPDLSIVYRQKKELKKIVPRYPVRRLVWIMSAAAALLLLFIGIRYFYQSDLQPINQVISPVASLPAPSSGETAVLADQTTTPVITKSQMKSETRSIDPSTTIARQNTVRIKPIQAKEAIPLNPSSSIALNLAQPELIPAIPLEKKDRSLIGKVIDNMVAQARDGLSNRPRLEKARKGDFNIWSLAKAGIEGFNTISDRELELYVKKDESGKVKSYALVEEERLILSKDLNKN